MKIGYDNMNKCLVKKFFQVMQQDLFFMYEFSDIISLLESKVKPEKY